MMTIMRNVGRSVIAAGAAGLLSMVLSSCVSAPPEPVETVAAKPTPAPVTMEPLTCEDLVTTEQVATALTGDDGVRPDVVPALPPLANLEDHITDAAGGLSCSWRAGEPPSAALTHADDADWAYLTIEVLPGGAPGWKAWAMGDGEHEELTEFAGVDAIAGCGDPGCGVYTAVGDSSVTVKMIAAGWGTGQSRYEGTEGSILAQLEPATSSVIDAISTAAPERLAWPRLDTSGSRECNGALDPAGIAAALDVEEVALERTTMVREGTAADVVGLYICQVVDVDLPFTMITVGRGLAPILDSLATTADTSDVLESVALAGAVEGERALLTCSESSSYCTVLFSIGATAYQVQSKGDAIAIAEAMIAQAR